MFLKISWEVDGERFGRDVSKKDFNSACTENGCVL